jgi:aminoglycoside phosphotransferase (APT) family kinase protein
MRANLDRCSEKRPALEFVLGWLLERAPQPAGPPVLVHGDFRTGNYMVDKGRLTGILDWEFAHWGDRHEDLGWFCARCWRFGNDALEAGGIASRQALFDGYDAVSDSPVDRAAMPYWEVLAAARWAVVALLQGERHITGGETSLELLLTGMMAPEMEYDALLGIEAIEGWAADTTSAAMP